MPDPTDARPGFGQRILDRVALPAEGDLAARSRIFLRVLLLHLTTRDTIRLLEGQGDDRAFWALGFALCFGASFRLAWLRAAAVAALVVATWKGAVIFPGSSNHFFLEYVSLLLAAIASWRRDADLHVFLCGVRWLPVLVFFWSGVNKALYGTYFNGAYLGSVLPFRGFRTVFGLMMGDAELARLLAVEHPGPYAFEAPLALLASNAVWIGELAAAFLLLFPRTRALGALAGLGLLFGIELGARELLFGALMTNMLGLYAPVSWSRRLAVGSAGFYAVLLVASVAAPPGWFN